jgi:hypothetical protein
LVVAMPIGVHHLLADGFTICASVEIAGRLRGGRGALDWLTAPPWGSPGIINMSYQLDAMGRLRHCSSEREIAMTKFTPFADDAESTAIDKLTIENGTAQISLYGSLDITRDKVGPQHALVLKGLIGQVVDILTSSAALPQRLPPVDKAKTVRNPFK